MSGSVTVRDKRRLPFVMVTKAAIETIRGRFDKRRGPTALSIYVALVECANDARSESFATPREEIARRGMVEIKAFERYAPELERLGLVRIESGKQAGQPNTWTLTDPPEEGACAEHVPGGIAGHVPPTDGAHVGGTDPGHAPLVEGEKKEKKTKKETEPTASLQSRQDLLDLSNQLADAIRANDPKASLSPESRTWLDPLRLLVDRDGRSAEEVAAVIEWCQTDDFERRNVLSPGKLRKRFTELWLKAQSVGAVQRENTTPIPFRRQTVAPQSDLADLVAQPLATELAAEWAPIAAQLVERTGGDEGATIWLRPLHLHQSSADGLVLGCPPQQGRWTQDRFGRLLEEVAGRPVRIVECRCAQGLAA
jgi:hypothetical protein